MAERWVGAGKSSRSFAGVILPVWLVTAAWDAVCATALGVLGYGATAASVWQGVGATALGSAAPLDGRARLIAGRKVESAARGMVREIDFRILMAG